MKENVYMRMSIGRVIGDAKHGVSLARQALRIREPERARALGLGIEPLGPGRQKRRRKSSTGQANCKTRVSESRTHETNGQAIS